MAKRIANKQLKIKIKVKLALKSPYKVIETFE